MDLQALIDSQPPNGPLNLPPGEFFGQVTIDRPLIITGRGRSTWIGSKVCPTIRITAGGVTLKNFVIEAPEGKDYVAVEALPGTNAMLKDVVVRGGIVGVLPENITSTASAAKEKPRTVVFEPPPPLDIDASGHVGTSSAQPSSSVQPQPPAASGSRSSWFPWVIVAALMVTPVGVLLFFHNRNSEISKTLEIERFRQEKEQTAEKLREMERQKLETERLEKERLERARQEKEQALAKLREMERQKVQAEERERDRLERERQKREQALARQRERERLDQEQRERERQDRERRAKQQEIARQQEIERERLQRGRIDRQRREQEDALARIKELSVDYYNAMIRGDRYSLLTLYDFPMSQYFSKSNASRSFVENDMDNYFGRWSQRSGSLQSVSVLTGTPLSGSVTVRIVYDYSFVTKSGNTKRGKSTTDVFWQGLGGTWKIKATYEGVDRHE